MVIPRAKKIIYVPHTKNIMIWACVLVGWLVLLLYVPSQQLWSLRDGQFT